jgi:hypothetical protein
MTAIPARNERATSLAAMATSIKRRAKATFRITTSSDGDSFDRTVGRKALLHAAPQRIDTVRYAIII